MLLGPGGSLALWGALLVGSAVAVARRQLQRGHLPWHIPSGCRILDVLGPILMLVPAVFVSAWGAFGALSPAGLLLGCGALVLVQVGRLFLAKLLGAATTRVQALEVAAAHSAAALTLFVLLILHGVPGHVVHGGTLQRVLAVTTICIVGALLLRVQRDLSAADPPPHSFLSSSLSPHGLPLHLWSVAQTWCAVGMAAALGRVATRLTDDEAPIALGILCGMLGYALCHVGRARRLAPVMIHRELMLTALPIALVSGLAQVSWSDAQHWVQQTGLVG